MSLIKSIKQVLGLSGTAAENHFWDGSVPNQLTLKRGTPDAPGATVLQALNGVLSFPNQGQSLTPNGYVKLPGGLIVQWGGGGISVPGDGVTVSFPIPFTTITPRVIAQNAGASGSSGPYMLVGGITNTSFNVWASSLTPGFGWIAVGY